MVNRICILTLLFARGVFAAVFTVYATPNEVLHWEDYSHLPPADSLLILLPDVSQEVFLSIEQPGSIGRDIQCNGTLKIFNPSGSIKIGSSIQAPFLIVEAKAIHLDPTATLDVSGDSQGGTVYLGGGWHGENPSIQNAEIVFVSDGSRIYADARTAGPGGTVVLWADRVCGFEGTISAEGKGSGNGGNVEVSSARFLFFDGVVSVASEGGLPGQLLLDPVSITIQAANPDLNGNNTGLNITNLNQLNNATTTPAGFPNASSVITASALIGLLTNNANVTLAAQDYITLNTPFNCPSTNVTITVESPTINLNAPVTLGSGGVLQGVGVTTVNVGPLGLPQNGIDIAPNGCTVNLASVPAGTPYVAPWNIINKNITIRGNGIGNTILKMIGAVPVHSGRNPMIYISGASNVIIEHLTVDGNYTGFPTNGNIVGILYANAGGTVSNCHITKIANEPPPYTGGGQQGNCIRASITSGGPYSLTVDSCTVDFFQKAGMVFNGSPLNLTVTNNTVAGYGSPIHLASIGIQVSSGASGTLSGNSVTGLQYTDHESSVGILLFDAGSNVTVSNNTVSNNDEGILSTTSVVSTGMIIENNIVQNNGDSGIAIIDSTGDTQILSNQLSGNGGLSNPPDINAGIYLFSSTNESFEVSYNAVTPAPGTSAIFIQGQASGAAPNVTLLDNTFPP